MTMVSGLSGTSGGYAHFFRHFTRMMKAEALARGGGSAGLETLSAVAAAAMEDEQSSEGSDEMIAELEERNREVIAHEATHMAAGGAYIKGGASYTYQIGPDGKSYAIGGEVTIDMSPIPGNPRATIAKMMAIRAAALAPSDPSAQDMAVASAAAQMEAQARAQLSKAATNDAASSLRTAAGRYAKPAAASGTFLQAAA